MPLNEIPNHFDPETRAIHAWHGAMQAAPPAIEQRAGRSETAVITPAAAEQSQEVRAR
jgi:hypothetical protein